LIRLLLTLAVVSVLALPAVAQDKRKKGRPGKGDDARNLLMQVVRRFDRDRDGRLSPLETRELMLAVDRNLDGNISPLELQMAAIQKEGKKDGKRKKEK
jgi:hypothetical protein